MFRWQLSRLWNCRYSPGRIKLTIKMESTIEKKDPDNFNTNEVPRVTFFKEDP